METCPRLTLKDMFPDFAEIWEEVQNRSIWSKIILFLIYSPLVILVFISALIIDRNLTYELIVALVSFSKNDIEIPQDYCHVRIYLTGYEKSSVSARFLKTQTSGVMNFTLHVMNEGLIRQAGKCGFRNLDHTLVGIFYRLMCLANLSSSKKVSTSAPMKVVEYRPVFQSRPRIKDISDEEFFAQLKRPIDTKPSMSVPMEKIPTSKNPKIKKSSPAPCLTSLLCISKKWIRGTHFVQRTEHDISWEFFACDFFSSEFWVWCGVTIECPSV